MRTARICIHAGSRQPAERMHGRQPHQKQKATHPSRVLAFSANLNECLNCELLAILACDPARRFATARPRRTGFRIAILRCDAGTRTADLAGFHAAQAEFGERKSVIGDFLLHVIEHFGVFARLRFFDLLLQLLSLGQQVLVRRHGFPFRSDQMTPFLSRLAIQKYHYLGF